MRKKKTSVLLFVIVIFIILFLIIRPYYRFLTHTLKISPFKTLLSLESLPSYNDQINILILGIAGKDHDGPNLSDSITVANYDFKTNKLLTISLPRDIWSDTLEDKINSAYAYGEAKQKGGGLKLAKVEIQSIVGMPIQYGAVIDFEKFKELIDFLGGVDVKVERSFIDHDFPIAGKENDTCGGDLQYRCRYETVSFNKGSTHMDGTAALKFVRSRHAQGEEGSDFARTKRQQKVLEAVKNKTAELVKSFDVSKLEKLYGVIDPLITRDISNQQLAIIAKHIFLTRNFSQKQLALDSVLFEVPDYISHNGQYVLVPKSANYHQIQSYIQCYKNAISQNQNTFAKCERLKNNSK